MAERLFLSRPSTLTPEADAMDVDVDDPRPATPSRSGTEYHTPPPRSPPPARCATVSDVEEEVRSGKASKEPFEPNKPTTTNVNQSQNETQDRQPQSQTRPEETHTHAQHTTHEIDTFDIFEPQQALPLIHHRKSRKQRQRGGWFADSRGRHDDEIEERMMRENARPPHFDAPRYHDDDERYDEHERNRHNERIEERSLDDRHYLERGDRDLFRNKKEMRREERHEEHHPEERGGTDYRRELGDQYRQGQDRRDDRGRDERRERERRHEQHQGLQQRGCHPQSARDDRERREGRAPPNARLPSGTGRLEPDIDREQPARRDDRRGFHDEGRRDVRLEDLRREDQHRGEQRRDSHRHRDDTYRDRDPQRREASREGREARRDTRRDSRAGGAAGETSRGARAHPSSSGSPSRPHANRAPSRAPKRPADSDSDIEYMGCNKKTRPGVDATKAIKTESRDDVKIVREERRTEKQAPQAPPAPRSDSGELREIEPGERGGSGAGARACGECGCECRVGRREPGRGRGSTVLSLRERRNLLSVLLGTPAAARPTNPLSHIRRAHPNLQSWGEVTRYIGAAPGNEERVRQTAGDMMREVPGWVRK